MEHTEAKDSASSLIDQIEAYAAAGVSLIQVRTREPLRAAHILREHFLVHEDMPYHEWTVTRGWREFSEHDYIDNKKAGDETQFLDALQRPLNELRATTSALKEKPDRVHYYSFVNPQFYTQDNPFVLDHLLHYASILPLTNAAIILITDDRPLPSVPQGLISTCELRTPTLQELTGLLNATLETVRNLAQNATNIRHIDLDDEDVERVAQMGLGLTSSEFETHSSLTITGVSDAGEDTLTVDHLLKGIAVGKTEVIKQSSILELIEAGDMSEVGGMNRLKKWLDQRKNCFSDEAKEFGIKQPKGAVIVGVPGVGKSLIAKAVASSFGLPLVRLDFGRVFSKYIGESESQVRSALQMIEDMSPCILFVDEIDKGLGGIGSGGGDGGVSVRVLGSFLTWLQENKKPVFTVVTANKVEGLPPELLRKGRFDQIFSATMPSETERLEVLAIHLRNHGQDLKLSEEDEARFLSASDKYVPAEIAGAVNDALILAFDAGEDFGIEHIVQAHRDMIPMSKSNAARIDAIIAWARDNAMPVHDSALDKPTKAATSRASSRIAQAGTRRMATIKRKA